MSSNPDDKFWDQLREEAAGVFKSEADWIDHASLPKLSLADSTIRETSRINPMLTKILLREVVAKDGATLPSGHQVPKGAWVAVDTVGVHHDDRFYLKPNEYQPFRFSGKNEDVYDVSSKANLTDKASIYRKNQDLSTTSDIFLSFGHRKHSWLVPLLKRPIYYRKHVNNSQSRSMACSSSNEVDARLCCLELRYSAYCSASCELCVWGRSRSFS